MTKVFERDIFFKAVKGSHNYNMNTPTSDVDWEFVVMPNFHDLYTGTRFAQAEQSAELDYSCHDIRKMADMLKKANPAYVETLFSVNFEHDGSPLAVELFSNPEKWATMNMSSWGAACWNTHMKKMDNLFKGTATTAPIVERYGYDTKEAHHALRYLYMMERFANTHSMKFALRFERNTPQWETLMAVKMHEVSLQDFYAIVRDWKNNNAPQVPEFIMNLRTHHDIMAELDEMVYSRVEAEFC